MAVTISGTSGVTTPADTVTGPISVGPQGITFGDSTVQTTAAVTGATGVPVLNVYTSPGTWTKPASVKAIKVTVVGGGVTGTPGPPSGVTGAGNGGGAGGGSITVYPAPSIPGPQPYTVGAAASTSSFGISPLTVVTATGGSGVTGGAGSGGQVNISGQNGGSVYSAQTYGGQGGSSILGFGGPVTFMTGASGATNGTAGTGYGSGGSGGAKQAPVTPGGAAGGAGAAGVVIVEEFY